MSASSKVSVKKLGDQALILDLHSYVFFLLSLFKPEGLLSSICVPYIDGDL